MIWLMFLGLAALVLAPLGWTLFRPARLRPRDEADLALYRAQLAELEREKAMGRMDEAAYRAAVVEVQRRLLAAPAPDTMAAATAGETDASGRAGRSAALLAAVLFLAPAAGLGLYLWRGQPDIPAAPFVERAAAAARDDALLGQLRARLELAPPGAEATRQGWILLGNAERGRGRPEAAVEAWARALALRFEGPLAAELAELQIERGALEPAQALLAQALQGAPQEPRLRYLSGLVEAEAGRPANARGIWRALLEGAPADAPWRALVERRLRELP